MRTDVLHSRQRFIHLIALLAWGGAGAPHRPQEVREKPLSRSYFHIHLVSDSTGETLIAVSRAAAAQYEGISAIEHVYPLVRSKAQLERVIAEIDAAPGIVLYTLVEPDLAAMLEAACIAASSPCLHVLDPVQRLFESYLGMASLARPGAQHTLNADYFRRIEAMNFTLMHDDGQMADDVDAADVVLLGVSRTSKTPTSIYLANRGIKTANIPLVPGVPVPPQVMEARKPLIVGLIATPERIVEIRRNRLLSLRADEDSAYVDRDKVAEEIAQSRRLCSRNNWPVIDVTRRSIEETAATIIELHRDHRLKFIAL
ncbi:putative pyruvate, phosphate dikinase regulatory protein [Chelatococcus asaccharovorans]|nr:putative pyruvate, phosphate dikinase regulatory protein [Chelatococcus asaccharovorans]CAH1684575.1 putative pyruvate, phosphate dikinase regulatory protein [Chelatococcus asaccharovorans]